MTTIPIVRASVVVVMLVVVLFRRKWNEDKFSCRHRLLVCVGRASHLGFDVDTSFTNARTTMSGEMSTNAVVTREGNMIDVTISRLNLRRFMSHK